MNLLLRPWEELEPLSLALGTDSERCTLADTVDFGVTLLAAASWGPPSSAGHSLGAVAGVKGIRTDYKGTGLETDLLTFPWMDLAMTVTMVYQ